MKNGKQAFIPNFFTEDVAESEIEEQTEPERVFIKPGKKATRKEIEAKLDTLDPTVWDGWGHGYRAALLWVLGRDAEIEEDYLMN